MVQNKSKEVRIEEELLMKDSGYLRVPKAVRQKFGTPRKFPQPEWTIGEDDDSLSLTFKFLKKKIGGGA